MIFLARLYECTESAIALSLACLSFYIKDFYVIGKALTGKLSCLMTGLVIMVYEHVFSTIFMEGSNFCDLFASVHYVGLLKWGLALKESIVFFGSKFSFNGWESQ